MSMYLVSYKGGKICEVHIFYEGVVLGMTI